jgi:hypothetical protein
VIGATGRGRCQTHGRADAPTGLWKTARTRFPTPPTAIIVLRKETKNRTKTTDPYLEPLSLEANTG